MNTDKPMRLELEAIEIELNIENALNEGKTLKNLRDIYLRALTVAYMANDELDIAYCELALDMITKKCLKMAKFLAKKAA